MSYTVMRSSVRAVFCLAMVLLGLLAAEFQSAGHRTANAQDPSAGEAQDRRMSSTPCWKNGRITRICYDDSDDSVDPRFAPDSPVEVASANYNFTDAPPRTPEPSSAHTAKQLSPELPPMAPTDTPTDMDVLLDLHNEARCLHNADALTYNDDMASSAMAHAKTLARTCGELYYSDSDDRNDYGENLYLCWGNGTTSCYTPEAAMASLYESEVQVDTVAQYGEHAAQILWKSTTEMGCAVETCDMDDYMYTYVVCQYNPAGNIFGKLEEEVELPSGDSC